MLWPFEGRRLVTVHALRLALLAFIVAIVARFIVAGTLWLTDDEAIFWQLSRTLSLSYGDQPPLSFWLAHVSTFVFGNSLLAIRLPSLVLSIVATLYLIKIVIRFGWAKGSDVVAFLSLATPALLLSGVLAGSQALLIALWLALLNSSFSLAVGAENSALSWKKLTAFSVLALLTDSLSLCAIAAALVSVFSTAQGRQKLRKRWPFAAFIAVATLAQPFAFPAALDLEELALNALLYAALCGPVLLYGWFILARARDRSRNQFLLIWALAGIPSIVFACVPVIIYFAKLSVATLRPRIVRLACTSAVVLSFMGLVALYGTDMGWRKMKPHLGQLPAEMSMIPMFAEDTRTAAQASYAINENVRALKINGRAPAASSTMPEKFLFISKADHKSARSHKALSAHLCEDYSQLKSIHLAYCRKPLHESVKTLKPIAQLKE